MSEYKPITYELREMMSCFTGFTDFEKGKFAQMCDSIDSIHMALEAECEQYRDGWVELPKDADGMPIRVGDKVQLIGNDPSTVSHMSLADDGWRVYVKYDGGIGTGSGEPKRIRHYHEPTVEDVLREFGDKYCDMVDGCAEESELFAEYAAKLQLRSDVE